MALNVVVLGPPGAGKGTQAERLARAQEIPKISTGDILREAVQADTELGRLAKATMEAGGLVSDEVMIEIVRERLGRQDAHAGFVLDGFPRTVAQAEALDEITRGRTPLIVVDIGVPEAELVRRISSRRVCDRCGLPHGDPAGDTCGRCGGRLVQRPDDAEDVVRARLEVYARDTEPLVRYYQSRETFTSIDGDRPPEVVAGALQAAVLGARPSSDSAGTTS